MSLSNMINKMLKKPLEEIQKHEHNHSTYWLDQQELQQKEDIRERLRKIETQLIDISRITSRG